jgi:transketolase
MKDLRSQFITELIELREQDSTVRLLVIDVGYSFAEPFQKQFPESIINTGTIEQSAVGIAAGMAMGGLKPYVYTVVNFLVFRAYEQIRNDIAYQKANVKLIGVRGKESYKFLGFSHNITKDEDRKVLEVMPNIRIAMPRTEQALHIVMKSSYENKLPTYIRL